ncbi:MAG: 30S ribosomal protein S4, partial [Proteobacteria bacterium]
MSRYTGPRVKKMRALGVELPGLSRKKIERRPYPPGQHGQARKKVSEFALRLHEKQKLRYNYGIGERQLRGLMTEALSSKTAPGKKLIELLERRLDNAVFRAGFALTIPAARQLVAHGHVLV